MLITNLTWCLMSLARRAACSQRTIWSSGIASSLRCRSSPARRSETAPAQARETSTRLRRAGRKPATFSQYIIAAPNIFRRFSSGTDGRILRSRRRLWRFRKTCLHGSAHSGSFQRTAGWTTRRPWMRLTISTRWLLPRPVNGKRSLGEPPSSAMPAISFSKRSTSGRSRRVRRFIGPICLRSGQGNSIPARDSRRALHRSTTRTAIVSRRSMRQRAERRPPSSRSFTTSNRPPLSRPSGLPSSKRGR